MKFGPLNKMMIAAAALVWIPQAGAALIVDLTTTDSSGSIGDALFVQTERQPTGTGFIDSFVQIFGTGNANESHAYNTTQNNTLDNGPSDNFNRSITIGDINTVMIDGTLYREFLLDINESESAAGDSLLSLDDVQIFLGGTANSDVETFTDGVLDHDGTLVYHMDAVMDMDNFVALDYGLNSGGSGQGDMFMYVDDALFAGFDDNDIVTLYSHFGAVGIVDDDSLGIPQGNYHTSANFEEWAVREGNGISVVPEPSTIGLLLVGLVGLGVRKSRRARA